MDADLLRVAVRALIAYVALLVLVRRSGKQMIMQGAARDFTIALVMGDIVDNMIWGEVAASQFLVASVTLFATHAAFRGLRRNHPTARRSRSI